MVIAHNSVTSSSRGDDPTTRTPREAFTTLANETRIQILQTLGEATEPLSFTELRDRVGIRQGEQFNYHLDKLVGHFIAKTDDGYTLRTPGSRVVHAVCSGAITDHPVIEPTVLEQECYHCGAPTVLKYGGHLAVFCTKCPGNYELPIPDAIDQSTVDIPGDTIGLLAGYDLPPAGIQGRSDSEALRAGTTWANLYHLATRAGICSRCSAQTDVSIQVCDRHDRGSEACDVCGNRYAVIHTTACTNCNFERRTQFARLLLADTDLLYFITGHGINPIAPDSPMALMAVLDGYEEEVVSTDPFMGRFTFRIDDDAITLTVDEELCVVDVTRESAGTQRQDIDLHTQVGDE